MGGESSESLRRGGKNTDCGIELALEGKKSHNHMTF